jgi:hypothetical protein
MAAIMASTTRLRIVGVDDVLQRLAKIARRVHALLHRLVAEHLPAQLEAALFQFPGIHVRLR